MSVVRAPFVSPLAEELAGDVLARFKRYVVIDTAASPDSTTTPSRVEQLDLSRLLLAELRELGLEDARMNDHGYVIATLPATVDSPVVGLLAHVDTSPDAPGAGVKPIVHDAWDGQPIVLPGDSTQVIAPDEFPALATRVGHDIVTSDGTTLLGADDKAGIAEIMAAVAYLARNDDPRATLRIAFTTDEEIGNGADHLDLDEFGADLAYTLDGSGLGEIELETFSAYEVKLTVHGVSTHPGTAKGRLVNAIKLLADVIAELPRTELTPETTEGREGFLHPVRIAGNSTEASAWTIVRDHDSELLERHVEVLRAAAERVVEAEPRASFTFEIVEQYRNMRAKLDERPEVAEAAEEAMRRAGVEPVHAIIRGGTDGARLTERGLPTPNIFTGGQEYHSVREWASLQDMAAAAATVVMLARVWGERGSNPA